MKDQLSTITYDARSFIINGERVFLTSGSIHYPRVPRELWRDRIQKAKAAGINTIQLYFFWNVHEPIEGSFNFSGNADITELIDMIAEEGLWVVARPGPYICAEWDAGGFPSWLYTKKGVETRTLNPIYLNAVELYWNRLLPILAERQVTRGGNIILCQIENELNNELPHGPLYDKARARYMDELIKIARRNGIDVPLITCEGNTPGTIECINAFKPASRFADYRIRQPEAPLHCTELWPGWYDIWQRPTEDILIDGANPSDPVFTERELWRILAMGGSGYNFYMWHGGTNFGYTTMFGQTTSYYNAAPLSESGSLNHKYHVTRRVNLFAQLFKDVLLNAPVYNPALHSRQISDGVIWHQRESAQGCLWFFENQTNQSVYIDLATIDPTNHKHIQVAAGCVRPVVTEWWLDGVRVSLDSVPITKINAGGETYIIALDPNLPENTDYDRPCLSRQQIEEHITLITLSASQLERMWTSTDGRLYVGPYYLRETPAGHVGEVLPLANSVWMLTDDGWDTLQLTPQSVPQPPALSDWQYAPGAEEAQISYDDSSWTATFMPMNRVLIGDSAGYGWYRSRVESDRDREATLTLTALADRALLYINGDFVAVSQIPSEDRAADPSLTARVLLRKGTNTIAVLTDNLGHLKGAWQFRGRPLDEDKKGLFGDVLVDYNAPVTEWRMRRGLSIGHAQRVMWRTMDDRTPTRCFRSSFHLTQGELDTPDRELHVYMHGMGKGVLYVNGINLGRYWNINGHIRYYMPKCWLRETNEIVLFEETDASPEHVELRWDEYAISGLVSLPQASLHSEDNESKRSIVTSGGYCEAL